MLRANMPQHLILNDLDPMPVSRPHQRLILCGGPKPGIGLKVVNRAVAVKIGVLRAVRLWDKPGGGRFDNRREPKGRDSQIGQVWQFRFQTLEVAAMVGVGIAPIEHVLLHLGPVIAGVAVGEPVGHHQVDHIVGPHRRRAEVRLWLNRPGSLNQHAVVIEPEWNLTRRRAGR